MVSNNPVPAAEGWKWVGTCSAVLEPAGYSGLQLLLLSTQGSVITVTVLFTLKFLINAAVFNFFFS